MHQILNPNTIIKYKYTGICKKKNIIIHHRKILVLGKIYRRNSGNSSDSVNIITERALLGIMHFL